MNRRKSCSSHGDHHLEQSEPWRDGWVSNHLCHWLSRTYTNTPRFRRKAGARSLDDDHISVDYLSLSYSLKYPIVHEKFQETVRSVASQLLGTLGCDTDKVSAIDTSRCDALSRMDKNWLTDLTSDQQKKPQSSCCCGRSSTLEGDGGSSITGQTNRNTRSIRSVRSVQIR